MTDFLIDSARQGSAQIDHVQVFGERRTGTNFIEALLPAQLKIDSTRRYGWKHGCPSMPCILRNALFVVVMRNPLSWLFSLHNRPFAHSHIGLPFPEFLRREWSYKYFPGDFGHARFGYEGMPKARGVPAQLDRHPITGACYANPLELRQIKAQAMLGLLARDCNVAIIDYDTTRRAPSDVAGAIADRFDIAPRQDASLPGPVGPSGHKTERMTLETLTSEDAAFILAHLDQACETRLGYGAALVDLKDRVAA